MPEHHGEYVMLAQRVNNLEVGHAKLQINQEHAAVAMERLADSVDRLTAAMNTGKGWANAFLWIAGSGGIMGAVAFVKQLFNH